MSDKEKFRAASDQAKKRSVSRHAHSKSCSDSSCPGNGFITREQLVAQTLARKVRSKTPLEHFNPADLRRLN